MANVVTIGGTIPYITESGGGVQQRPPEILHRVKVSRSGNVATAWYDPLTQVFGPTPKYTPVDEDVSYWHYLNASATDFVAREFGREEDFKKVMYYKEHPPTTWAAYRNDRLQTGQGFWCFVHTYGSYFALAFGGDWNLWFFHDSPLQVRWGGNVVATGPAVDLVERDIYILVYNIGPWLVVKMPPDWAGGLAVPAVSPFADTNGNPVALGNEVFGVTAAENTWFAYRELEWYSPWQIDLRDHVQLVEPSNTVASGIINGWQDPNLTVTSSILDQNDVPWVAGGYSFRWRIVGTQDEPDDEPYRAAWINRVDVRIPRKIGWSGTSGTDVGGLVQELEWTQGLTPDDTTLRFRIKDDVSLASYIEQGQRVDWVEDGSNRFTGLVVKVRRELQAGGIEDVWIEASAGAILNTGTAMHFPDQSGALLSAALTECFNAAGIPTGNLTLTDVPAYVLPSDGAEPIAPRAGDPPGKLLAWLLESFAADVFIHADYGFVFEVTDKDSGAVAATFSTTAASPPYVEPGSADEAADDAYYNAVFVAGQDVFGQLLFAWAINWNDLKNQQPYRWRVLVIIDDRYKTQAVVNWVCLGAFNLTSNKPVRFSWKGSFVEGLRPNDRCTVGSLGTYRLTRRVTRVFSGGRKEVWHEGIKVA